jgi:hypothetical protein
MNEGLQCGLALGWAVAPAGLRGALYLAIDLACVGPSPNVSDAKFVARYAERVL